MTGNIIDLERPWPDERVTKWQKNDDDGCQLHG